MVLPILKIFLLLLLSITANSKPTKIYANLFKEICSKTILPNHCAFSLKMLNKDGNYSSLEEVGVAFLDRTISTAKRSMDLFNLYLKKDYIAKKFYLKAKYDICGEKYQWAMDKLSEAKAMLKAGKFAEARDILEDVSKVPTYCENLTRSTSSDLTDAYESSDYVFDVALAIARELERRTRNSTMSLLT